MQQSRVDPYLLYKNLLDTVRVHIFKFTMSIKGSYLICVPNLDYS